jgi:hypothetical protein
MPVYRKPVRNPGPELETFVGELASELKSPKQFGQPMIKEDATPETNSLRVHVIWDRWSDYDPDFRYIAILNAYERAYGKATRDQITLALGLTVPEAVSVGLLPFQVRPAARAAAGPSDEELRGKARRRRTEIARERSRPSDREYREALLKLGASTLADADHPQLRFATEEAAGLAHEQLKRMFPNSSWVIAEYIETDAS